MGVVQGSNMILHYFSPVALSWNPAPPSSPPIYTCHYYFHAVVSQKAKLSMLFPVPNNWNGQSKMATQLILGEIAKSRLLIQKALGVVWYVISIQLTWEMAIGMFFGHLRSSTGRSSHFPVICCGWGQDLATILHIKFFFEPLVLGIPKKVMLVTWLPFTNKLNGWPPILFGTVLSNFWSRRSGEVCDTWIVTYRIGMGNQLE